MHTTWGRSLAARSSILSEYSFNFPFERLNQEEIVHQWTCTSHRNNTSNDWHNRSKCHYTGSHITEHVFRLFWKIVIKVLEIFLSAQSMLSIERKRLKHTVLDVDIRSLSLQKEYEYSSNIKVPWNILSGLYMKDNKSLYLLIWNVTWTWRII